MDSFELNKIAGAVLATLLVYLGVRNLGDALFHVAPANPRAYVIEVPQSGTQPTKAAAVKKIPIAELLKTASLERGMKVAKKCVACHSFAAGGKHQIGPALWAIVGRDIAAQSGFSYSKTLIGISGGWSYEQLNAFLENPKKWAPGTAMAFAGLRKPADRAAIIAYLDSLK